jgi:hypothetical protein
MAKLDPFSAQIVRMVREMPDEALLELVRNQLDSVAGMPVSVAASNGAPARRGRPPGKRKAAKGKRRGRGTSADREQTLTAVERVIKSSKGLSASEIASKTGLPKSRVQSAVRELKKARRIFQGGDRRFARYAGNARTAKQASVDARKNASGPVRN